MLDLNYMHFINADKNAAQNYGVDGVKVLTYRLETRSRTPFTYD